MTRFLIIVWLTCCCASGQQWYAGHFGGFVVPTLADTAELPIPCPGSNIRTVSTFTTTNTPCLLGDLTEKTLTATVWLECSNNPVFYAGASVGPSAPITMRLFITSDPRPYTEVHGLQNETAYWWCYATNGWSNITCGTNTLSGVVSPEGWSDALGHWASDPAYTPAFLDSVRHNAQSGLSFGARFFENGFGIASEDTAATLHVLKYQATGESIVAVQAIGSDSLDGPWAAAGTPILITNPPAFFKLIITKQ